VYGHNAMSNIHVSPRLDGLIGRLVLSNRAKHNALPQSAWRSVAPTLSGLVADGARVIILSGEGDNFCAGADISEFDAVRKNPETAHHYEASNVEAFTALRNCPVPTIAKIQGYCLGGGFGLAAACDLRVAAQGASFSVPAARLGLGYPVDAMADIVAAIGAQNTKKMLLTAGRFSCQEMLDMGFLTNMMEMTEIDPFVDELALSISLLAPLTHRATKAAVLAVQSRDMDAARAASDATFSSQDYAEGRQAFRERRTPHFEGK
jgi:enoyl-CoA hydratase/carnithine racemase